MSYALGVDIGGTKVSVTLGNSRGRILAKEVVPTETGKKSKRCVERIVATLERLRRSAGRSQKISGIGVGIPGPIEPKKGIVEKSPHLRGWQGSPLKSTIERKLKLPVFITNDANAAAVGEKMFGAGRGVRDFVYLTISTGIGGGVVLGGKLLLGASFGAGEVGHAVVVADGAKCGCRNRGCLEAYSSGTAIAAFVREKIREGRKSAIKRLTSRGITAEAVALAARKGDPLAREAFERAGHYLGIGLANLINLLNPQMLILGGSVMKSSRLFWSSMMRSTRESAWPTLYKACRIVKTELGDQVGDLGALALVFACRSGSDI